MRKLNKTELIDAFGAKNFYGLNHWDIYPLKNKYVGIYKSELKKIIYMQDGERELYEPLYKKIKTDMDEFAAWNCEDLTKEIDRVADLISRKFDKGAAFIQNFEDLPNFYTIALKYDDIDRAQSRGYFAGYLTVHELEIYKSFLLMTKQDFKLKCLNYWERYNSKISLKYC